MKFTKNKGTFLTVVLVVLIMFNVIAFTIPFVRGAGFWTGYGFSIVAIILSAGVGLYGLGHEGMKSKFYGFPIAYTAWIYLIVQVIVGFVEMALPGIPFQYSIVINVILMAASLAGLAAADIGKEEMERIDIVVEEKVFYIKSLQSDIEGMVSKAQDTELKKSLKDLAETIRYSDPMSSPQLTALENKIEMKVSALCEGFEQESSSAKSTCEELQQLFAERNRKVKLLK